MRYFTAIFAITILSGSARPESPVKTKDSIDRREQISVCEVHKIELLQEVAATSRITSIEFECGYEKAMQSQFPHLGFPLDVDDPDATTVSIDYCPACRKAHEVWHAKQQRKWDYQLFLDRSKTALAETLERCQSDSELSALSEQSITGGEWREGRAGRLHVAADKISIRIATGPRRPWKPSLSVQRLHLTTQVPLTRVTISTALWPADRMFPQDLRQKNSPWAHVRLQCYLRESMAKQGIDLRRAER